MSRNTKIVQKVYCKVELHAVVIHNIIYYHLSYTVNYKTFSLAVYPTYFDNYSVHFHCYMFYVYFVTYMS
jgi:hypothetical protein